MTESSGALKVLAGPVQRYESGGIAFSPAAHIAALQVTANRLDGELASYRSGGGAGTRKGGAQDKEVKKIESYKARIASLEASINSTERGLSDLSIEHAKAKRELASVSKEVTAEKSKALELEQALAESRTSPTLTAKIEAETTEARHLRALINRMSNSRGPGQLYSDSIRLQAAQNDVKVLKRELEGAKADREARAAEVDRLKAELHTVANAGAASLTAFSNSLASNVDVPRLVEMLKDLDSDIAVLRAEKMALTLKLAGVES